VGNSGRDANLTGSENLWAAKIQERNNDPFVAFSTPFFLSLYFSTFVFLGLYLCSTFFSFFTF